MKNSFRYFLAAIAMLLITSTNQAQTIIITPVYKQVGDFVKITYTLEAQTDNQLFEVKLYFFLNEEYEESKLSEKVPLIYVRGDVGKDKKRGKDKTIMWEPLKEYPDGIQGATTFIVVAICTRGCDWFKNDMNKVEGGRFEMGRDDKGTSPDEASWGQDEKPARQVQLSPFYISKYEVTQLQWQKVMGQKPSKITNPDCDDCPVNFVSWLDVQAFLERLEAQTGVRYRLPTEAEWEYAAIGGKQRNGFLYAGSGDISTVAWYDANSNQTAHPVGKKKPNELDLYDMTGNVWEWCSDVYSIDYYKNAKNDNPQAISGGTNKVLRGGSWKEIPDFCRIKNRHFAAPDTALNNVGFRLVRDVAK